MPSTQSFEVTEFTTPHGDADVYGLDYAFVDLNGDGYLDLVAATFRYPLVDEPADVLILLNDGDGTFSPPPDGFIAGGMPTTVHGRQVLVADFNGDGRPDIYIADHGYDAPPFPGA